MAAFHRNFQQVRAFPLAGFDPKRTKAAQKTPSLKVGRAVKVNLTSSRKRDGHYPAIGRSVPEYFWIAAARIFSFQDRIAMVFRKRHSAVLTVGNVLHFFV